MFQLILSSGNALDSLLPIERGPLVLIVEILVKYSNLFNFYQHPSKIELLYQSIIKTLIDSTSFVKGGTILVLFTNVFPSPSTISGT